jgi:hypothetical protein
MVLNPEALPAGGSQARMRRVVRPGAAATKDAKTGYAQNTSRSGMASRAKQAARASFIASKRFAGRDSGAPASLAAAGRSRIELRHSSMERFQ